MLCMKTYLIIFDIWKSYTYLQNMQVLKPTTTLKMRSLTISVGVRVSYYFRPVPQKHRVGHYPSSLRSSCCPSADWPGGNIAHQSTWRPAALWWLLYLHVTTSKDLYARKMIQQCLRIIELQQNCPKWFLIFTNVGHLTWKRLLTSYFTK